MKKLFSFLCIISFSCFSMEARSPYVVRSAIATLENIRGKAFKPLYANQDRAVVQKKEGKCFFGVFDGHGPHGATISEYVSLIFLNNLLETRHFCFAAEQVQKDLEENYDDAQKSGTTAIMGLLDGGLLTIGNIGDSRLLYLRRDEILFATQDHKPSDESEVKRIYDCGGLINGAYVYTQNSYGLALTRSFGDVLVHENNIVSADPTLYQVIVQKGDKMVIASDGLWDVLTNEDVKNVMKEISCGNDLETTVKYLVRCARTFGSKDDITAICTLFE